MQKKVPTSPEDLNARLARLPAVSRLLESKALAVPIREYGADLMTRLLRVHLDRLRLEIRAGDLEGLR